MKSNKDAIIYIGGFQLPNKNAAAQRVISNGKILRKLNYEVIFLGTNSGKKNEKIEKINSYSEFECWEEKYPQGNNEWWKHMVSIKNVKKLVNKKGKDNVRAIIAYNYPSVALLNLKLYCNKNNIKLISDCTEWYDAKNGKGLINLLKWMDTELRMKYINSNLDGIICISEYLYNKYKNKCNCILLPPLVDLSEEKWQNENLENNHEIVEIIYAGNPGVNKKSNSKDRIDLLIRYLYKFKDNYNFKLNILGITKEQYLNAFNEDSYMLQQIGDKVEFHGMVEHNQVIEKVKKASFIFFLRNDNRVTKAGFPTKFVEAISAGTPVITNKSSDLEKYLVEGINGYFIDIENEEKVSFEIEKILNIPSDKIIEMKKRCKEIKVFDYNNYIIDMENITR